MHIYIFFKSFFGGGGGRNKPRQAHGEREGAKQTDWLREPVVSADRKPAFCQLGSLSGCRKPVY